MHLRSLCCQVADFLSACLKPLFSLFASGACNLFTGDVDVSSGLFAWLSRIQWSFIEKFLAHRRGIYHTLTTGYDPQANGTAERAVGLIKALASRCLVTSGMDSEFWSYAVRYAAQALGDGMIKFPTERSVSGRLLFWDHLSDQGSCVLCQDDEHDEWIVYRAGLPVLAPPDAIPTPDAHDDHPRKGSDSSSRKIDDAHPEKGIDNSKLRTDEPGKGLSKFDRPLGADSDTPIEADDAIEVDFADLTTFEGGV